MAKKTKVVDLFAGAGGFSLGFKLTGLYSISCEVEQDHWAANTLRKNKSRHTRVIEGDIQKYRTNEDILCACGKQAPEVIIGGPPCQGFSNATSRKRDLNDPRNSLFKYFAKWIEHLKPTLFIMENVRGILTRCNSEGIKTIDVIRKTFSNIGYENLNVWRINSAEYGVPQFRERVFIVGHIKNISIPPPPKTHYISKKIKGLKKAVTVNEAVSDLPKIQASEGSEIQNYSAKPKSMYQKWARGDIGILYNHVAMKHTKRIIERFAQIKIGESVSDVSLEHKERKRNGNGEVSVVSYNMNNRRLNPNKPSYTIPASFYSSFIHPYLDRNLTAREAARLQSFPDNYRFMGKRTVISSKLTKRNGLPEHNHLSQYNQIGNAVPPLLAKAIAEHVHAFLNKNIVPIGDVTSHTRQKQRSQGVLIPK
ncbi:MAG: DNA cytosine methyltransferase [Elusimicrobiales bacterium]